MEETNINPSSVTYGILIKSYGLSSNLESAFKTF